MRLLIERDDVEADSRDKQDRHNLFYIGGRTPLSYAAEKGHEAVIRLLIKRDDVEINSKDARAVICGSEWARGSSKAFSRTGRRLSRLEG